jgi:hypothetical protein
VTAWASLALVSCEWLKAFEMGHNPRGWGNTSDIRLLAIRLDRASGQVLAFDDLGAVMRRAEPTGYFSVADGGLLADGQGYIAYFAGDPQVFADGPYWDPRSGDSIFCQARIAGGALASEIRFEGGYFDLDPIDAALPGEYLAGGKWLGEEGGRLVQRVDLLNSGKMGAGAAFRAGGGSMAIVGYGGDYPNTWVDVRTVSPAGALLAEGRLSHQFFNLSVLRAQGPDNFKLLMSGPSPEDPAQGIPIRALRFDAAARELSFDEVGSLPTESWDYLADLAGDVYWLKFWSPDSRYLSSIATFPGGTFARAAVPSVQGSVGYRGDSAGFADGSLLLFAPGTRVEGDFMGELELDRLPVYWDLAEEERSAREAAQARVSLWTTGPAGPSMAWEREFSLIPQAFEGLPHSAAILGALDEGTSIYLVAAVSRSF